MSRQGCFCRIYSTDKAYLLYPPEDIKKQFWIPRSVLNHVSMLSKPSEGKHELVQIEVDDWYIEKNNHLDRYFS